MFKLQTQLSLTLANSTDYTVSIDFLTAGIILFIFLDRVCFFSGSLEF